MRTNNGLCFPYKQIVFSGKKIVFSEQKNIYSRGLLTSLRLFK